MLITEKEKNTKENLYVKNDKVNIFVIGDTHFNHENIIKYCKRPFNNIQQMNETIINNWNKAVRPYDIVYHL